jgi:LysM repeat protein
MKAKKLFWSAQSLAKQALKQENLSYGLGYLNITMNMAMKARSAYIPTLMSNASPSLKDCKKTKNSPKFQSICLTALFVTLSSPTPSIAQQLIKCPHWKQLLEAEQIYGVRKSPPSKSFEVAINSTVKKPLGQPLSHTSKSRTKGVAKPVNAATCTPHTIKSGDTLYSIAAARLGSGLLYSKLAAANGIRVEKPLKIGQLLQIPCTSESIGGAALTSTSASTKTTGKVAAPVPIAAPLPVWHAKSGEYLTDTLRRWGKTAGYRIIKEGADDWRLSVPVSVRGTFEEATSQLVRGFEGTGRPPGISIYSNKVVKVGAP